MRVKSRAVFVGLLAAGSVLLMAQASKWPAGSIVFDDADTLQYKFDNLLLGGSPWTGDGETADTWFWLDNTANTTNTVSLVLESSASGGNTWPLAFVTNDGASTDQVLSMVDERSAWWSVTTFNLAGDFYAEVNPSTGILNTGTLVRPAVPDAGRSDGFDLIPMFFLQPDTGIGFVLEMNGTACGATCDLDDTFRTTSDYSDVMWIVDADHETAFHWKWDGTMRWGDVGSTPVAGNNDGTTGTAGLDVALQPMDMSGAGYLRVTSDLNGTPANINLKGTAQISADDDAITKSYADTNYRAATNCSASWSNVNTNLDDPTSLSTSKATMEFVHADITEFDGGSCWTLGTSGNAEFSLTASGMTDVVFDVFVSGTAKLSGAANVIQRIETGASGCIDGSGAATSSKKQYINLAGAAANLYEFYTAWPIHLGTITMSTDEEFCINLETTSGTDTFTIRDLNIIVRQR